MNLPNLGSKTKIENINTMKIAVSVDKDIDTNRFEIGVLYKSKTGEHGFLSFARVEDKSVEKDIQLHLNKGCYASVGNPMYDFVQLNTRGQINCALIAVWDHQCIDFFPVPTGFNRTRVSIRIKIDASDEVVSIPFSKKDKGNFALIGLIDFSSPESVVFANVSFCLNFPSHQEYYEFIKFPQLEKYEELSKMLNYFQPTEE